jgi:molecular chaperone GrpE (heat shock protein)
LRWYDAQGNWILTASEEKAVVEEQLQAERERAAVVQQELETERQRAEAERSRSQRLAELLRSQGIDPDSIT